MRQNMELRYFPSIDINYSNGVTYNGIRNLIVHKKK